MGLEPTTLGTTNRCSNRLSYILRVRDCKGSLKIKIQNISVEKYSYSLLCFSEPGKNKMLFNCNFFPETASYFL